MAKKNSIAKKKNEEIVVKLNAKKNLVLFIQGGAGDILAQTPMIRSFRNKYPDDNLIVLSTYSQLLEGNTHIDKVYPLADPEDFFSKYLFEKPVRFYKKHFIYDHLLDECAEGVTSLPEFACAAYGIDYDGGPPDYTVSDEEHAIVKTFLGQYGPENNRVPIVLLHCTGSIPSDGQMNKVHTSKDLNIETAAEVVKHFEGKIRFIQIGLEGEAVVPGAIDALGMPMREAIAMIPHTDSFLFIESIFAHAAAAFSAPGVILYQNTSPDFFKYPGYSEAIKVYDSGNCPHWPCNRPLGALMDLMPGYHNPKTRERLLWRCDTNLCRNIKSSELIKALEATLAPKSEKKDDK